MKQLPSAEKALLVHGSPLSYDSFEEQSMEVDEANLKSRRCVRAIVLVAEVLLFLSAVGVAVTVYLYTCQSEDHQFQKAFSGYSSKVLEGLGTSLQKNLGSLDALQSHVVSWARATNQTWPFVTTEDFAVRAAKIRLLSDIRVVSVHPLVTKDQRELWEAYSLANQGWVNESINVQATDEFYYGPLTYDRPPYGIVHNDQSDVPDDRPLMLPTWLTSPVVCRCIPFNWDLFSYVKPEAVEKSLSSHKVILSQTYNLPDMSNEEEVKLYEAMVEYFRDYVPPGQDSGEPLNDVYYPIVDYDMASVRIVDFDKDPNRPSVVGLLSASFYWRDLIKDLLSPGSDGVVVVFSSSCSPDFTYQIDGPRPTYLGRGDHHDAQFDSFKVESNLQELSTFFRRKSQYTGIPMDPDFCPVSVKVYPSAMMQSQYITTNPVIFTVGAGLIVVFTSTVFLLHLYSFFSQEAERRVRKVNPTEIRSRAMVSSMFASIEEGPSSPAVKKDDKDGESGCNPLTREDDKNKETDSEMGEMDSAQGSEFEMPQSKVHSSQVSPSEMPVNSRTRLKSYLDNKNYSAISKATPTLRSYLSEESMVRSYLSGETARRSHQTQQTRESEETAPDSFQSEETALRTIQSVETALTALRSLQSEQTAAAANRSKAKLRSHHRNEYSPAHSNWNDVSDSNKNRPVFRLEHDTNDFNGQRSRTFSNSRSEQSKAKLRSSRSDEASRDGTCERERRVKSNNPKSSHKYVSSDEITASSDLLDFNDGDRIYFENDKKKKTFKIANPKIRLKSFLLSDDATTSSSDQLDWTEVAGVTQISNGGSLIAGDNKTNPIAELFPDTTVMVADIPGLSAWGSARDPTQVITLVETLYGAFDRIAQRRGVFKVAAVGDAYVAVCGLPEPREDHAVVMTTFARDCRDKAKELTKKLEKRLGPETADLVLRFGLHSGPVTAGVLRGDRSRFQLFGDTVSYASRMESSGQPNMIQVSQKTAELLSNAGKSHWLMKRDDVVSANGAGHLKTYWVVDPSQRGSVSTALGTISESTNNGSNAIQAMKMLPSFDAVTAEQLERLIDWNLDAFTRLVKRIVARRVAMGGDQRPRGRDPGEFIADLPPIEPRSEIVDVIVLPKFEFNNKIGRSEVELSSKVISQLRDYISTIAYRYAYRSNPFHNFEHASHVVMSIMKLLQRVVSPEISVASTSRNEKKVAEELASNLHVKTYGIASDPLTQFAIVFAALVHDVDHPGVTNGQLVTEQDAMALKHDNQSVAEQNSVTIAWQLLMRPSFSDLRAAIFSSVNELMRFRQLVVNSVMATDIFDKELKASRESRWEKAFRSNEWGMVASSVDFNRKATIIIEQLIQASDVAHTMQHWTIYKKWNKRLFEEMYSAYKAGRAATNPANGWYKGELWFFDNYIIPLAKKLKECRVFGVSCDEFLDYAIANRTEWEAKGEDIVKELVELVDPGSFVKETVQTRESPATRTNAVVSSNNSKGTSSLVPSVVTLRQGKEEEQEKKKTVFKISNPKTKLKSFLVDDATTSSEDLDWTEVAGVTQITTSRAKGAGGNHGTTAPIADLFPDTTVLVADIEGFTGWSSVRDPTSVFTLLESLYGAFDSIAQSRGVFKVESTGDSYVAVCGLPEPREDHALVMVAFARDCRDIMNDLTRKFEKSLGPDTGDLKLRLGLNSGPVTAGVLRGDRSRFQLFGDTVNFAAVLESNGKPNMIHISQKTAALLTDAGKGHWLKERDEMIQVKGKGILRSYWVDPVDVPQVMVTTNHDLLPEKLDRLIEWNVGAFERLVKRIVSRRKAMGVGNQSRGLTDVSPDLAQIAPRSEIVEVVKLPEFVFNARVKQKESQDVDLSPTVRRQLRDYISSVAHMYRPNPFHNFEHATHVTMSIMKLLQRVVFPDVPPASISKNAKVAEELASNLYISTYGIASDPLTQFAIVFAALIHDVDHQGVTNGQLVNERDLVAQLYDNQSVAEQNSVALAWQLLMRPSYLELRSCLFADENELVRFRRLVVNAVMATDIFDKDLKGMRDLKWDKAFHSEDSNSVTSEALHRKATIVIEQLIQASDVSHTMQHWTIYQKWNKRLFEEMYSAFKAGRSPANPANGWYKGELWFFDNHIIPLARKLKEVRVFGVSCDEFLDYALDNRMEWEAKGETIVQGFLLELDPHSCVDQQATTPSPPQPLPVRSNAIAPSTASDLKGSQKESDKAGSRKKAVFKVANSKTKLKSFLSDGNSCDESETMDVAGAASCASPVAELFPETTVLFAEIAGFAAWSSVRDPTQIFFLLETLYKAFDAIARRRGVFKVESIGDSYVAVCGLPERRADHAVVMARFARNCRDEMNELTRKLETRLGPDTADLKLCFGLSSGPVTAGIFRGERERFQLFGDTVSYAARMQSSCLPNMIQVSQKTADLLEEAGKGNWLKRREDSGKGVPQTYWVDPTDVPHTGVSHSKNIPMTEKLERLIEWNLDAFERLVRSIVAKRVALGEQQPPELTDISPELATIKPRSEIAEVIQLPDFDSNYKVLTMDHSVEVELSPKVVWQLRDYISSIAYMYRSNAFHNFEHASHVAMSILKLLQRVVSPEVFLSSGHKNEKTVAEEFAANLHVSTYGIASDPLTQFAIVFAALVHDVDHQGVTNGQLVTEGDPLALLYDSKSVAEQNSVALAWQLLMRPSYTDLRACLFANESELIRFRQLVVNAVMATDIFDKDLKGMRDLKWDKAFHSEESGSIEAEALNRKATIVIEQLIQASDVAHTMQHWTIYQKWNKRLFEEMYTAFKGGRCPASPANGWYKGELWFFDNHIIPLAKKLKEAHVFGVSCDEFLDYALTNRMEWEVKGEAIVNELIQQMEAKSEMVEEEEENDNA